VIESAPIEFLEAEAWAQRVEALPARLKERLGTRVRRFGRAVALATPGADVASVNRTIGIGMDQPLDDALLSRVNDFFREAGVPRWLIDCGPHATIVGGPETLIRLGGALKTPTVKLAAELRDIDSPLASTVSVREIGRELSVVFRSIVGEAFGLPGIVEPDLVSAIGKPGWHYYMAFDQDRPIAGAAMFVRDAGAWFGVAGTAEDARNRGAQSALLARRLTDAKRLGCSWVTAETSPDTPERRNPSYHNMLRAGLRVAYLRDKYLFVNEPA
jgi:GNAT superfamily N-acetyltransferase